MATSTIIINGNPSVTREQAKQRAIQIVKALIATEGGNSVMVSNKWGHWSKNEVLQAIMQDKDLHNGKRYIKGTNPIDEMWNALRFGKGSVIFKG